MRRLTRSEEHTSELQSRPHLVCRLLLEKKKITLGTSFITGRVSNFQGPTDVAFDPITDTFLVADGLANQIGIVDPKAPGIAGFTPFRLGINPTSLDYNFQSGTGVTFNAASNSFSIFNFVATNPNSHFFFKDTAATEIYTLSLHDALPI